MLLNQLSRWHLFILLFAMAACNGNEQKKQSVKTVAVYNFSVPKGWTEERIAFPIEFAPQINYTGFENLRLAPGWEFTTSEEHWSYTFLWWLDNSPKIDAKILQDDLNKYYTGLVGRNVREKRIPLSKLVAPVTGIKQIATQQGDIETYAGSVVITDYLDINFNPITLNIKVHKKDCDHTALIFQISPRLFEHKIWKQLDELQRAFTCAK